MIAKLRIVFKFWLQIVSLAIKLTFSTEALGDRLLDAVIYISILIIASVRITTIMQLEFIDRVEGDLQTALIFLAALVLLRFLSLLVYLPAKEDNKQRQTLAGYSPLGIVFTPYNPADENPGRPAGLWVEHQKDMPIYFNAKLERMFLGRNEYKQEYFGCSLPYFGVFALSKGERVSWPLEHIGDDSEGRAFLRILDRNGVEQKISIEPNHEILAVISVNIRIGDVWVEPLERLKLKLTAHNGNLHIEKISDWTKKLEAEVMQPAQNFIARGEV